MRSRLLPLIIVLFTATVSLGAQSPWQPASVPKAEVPNEFILHFSHNGETEMALEAEFKNYHGVIVDVIQLDQPGRYFLVRLVRTVEETVSSGNFCSQAEGILYPLPCKLCDVIGDPGSGGPMDRGDTFTNVVGSAGYSNSSSNYSTYDLGTIFPGGVFNPLVGRPNEGSPSENDGDNTENCYDGETLPMANLSQQGQLRVAILDSGIAPDAYDNFFSYVDEQGVSRSMVAWEPIPSSVIGANVSQINIDQNGHGTAVAFLLAHDFVNGGKQSDIQLHSYRVLTNGIYGTLANLIWSLSHAIENDVDIINMSFGFRSSDCTRGATAQAKNILSDLFQQARQKNIIIFTSAGNDDSNLSTAPQWPAAYNTFENVFTVGADGCTVGQRWEESNYHGAYVDLMAPGFEIAMPHAGHANPGKYVVASGTSFATPLAASVAASWYAEGGFESAMCALDDLRAGEVPDDADNAPDSRLGSLFDLAPAECRSIIINPGDPGGNGGGEFAGRPGAGQQAFPNPFTAVLNVLVEAAPGGVATVRVLDGNGRLVMQRQTGEILLTLPTHDLVPGLYFLQIADENGSRVQRIIKQ